MGNWLMNMKDLFEVPWVKSGVNSIIAFAGTVLLMWTQGSTWKQSLGAGLISIGFNQLGLHQAKPQGEPEPPRMRARVE